MTSILVADDSETILLLMRTRLEMEGYEVTTAVDGQEVMEELARRGPDNQPDVILLDAMMPRKSGNDVLRELRAGENDVPVLIVSAHEEESASDRGRAPRANGYIRKPIDFEVLLGRIEELAGGNGAAQPPG